MAEHSTVARLAAEFGILLSPLAEAVELEPQPYGFLLLAESAALDLEGSLFGVEQLTAVLDPISTFFGTIRELVDGEVPDLEDLPALLEANQGIVAAVNELSTLEFVDEAVDLALELPRILVDYLIVRYLYEEHDDLYDILSFLGVVSPPDYDAMVPATFRPARLIDWLRDPGEAAGAVYGWGTDEFEHETLLFRLEPLLLMLGFFVEVGETSTQERAELGEGASPDEGDAAPPLLQIPLINMPQETSDASIGLRILSLLKTGSAPDAGLAVVPYGHAQTTYSHDFGGGVGFRFEANADANVPFGFAIRPGDVGLRGLGGQVPPPSISIAAALIRDDSAEEPIRLFGNDEAGKLDITSLGARIQVRHAVETDFIASIPVRGNVELKPQEDDGFLSSLLPAEGILSPFAVEVGWSARHGIQLDGSASLEVTRPVGRDLGGVITVDSATYAIGLDDNEIPISVAITGSTSLGPFTAVVDKLGIKATLSFPGDGGNLGPVNFDLGVKPPEGLGLSLDSDIVSGSGYLSYDHDKGEYAGVVALQIEDVGLTGIGILHTKRPDGRPGFSLLVIVNAEFPPVQLGLGFTLNGVGGLLAVNRTADIAALRSGVRSGAIGSVMFPPDPATNAPQILSDLQHFFPQSDGRFIIGPTFRIGWGPESMVVADIGLAIELPDPVRLLLFGLVQIGLPSPDEPTVDIRLSVFGAVDFNAGTIELDASLVDSKIASFPISGDAALRARYKANPSFALAIGGFHPRVAPPDNFPALGRVAINLSEGDNPRVRLEAYVALTSNTVQAGARIDAYAEKFDVAAEAFLTFDTLFSFRPFRFAIDMTAGATISAFGNVITTVDLVLSLSGPKPWHANGSVTFTLIWSVTIAFDMTIGEPAPTEPVELEDLRARLLAELSRPTAWSARRPHYSTDAVFLRDPGPQPTIDLLVHPMGVVEVEQSAVPLGVTIEKFGEHPPKDDTFFHIRSLRIGGANTGFVHREGAFAPAQFFHLTEEQKLSAPAYEPFTNGLSLNPGDTTTATMGEAVHVTPEYDTITHDVTLGQTDQDAARTGLDNGLMARMHQRTAVARQGGKRRGGVRFPGPKKKLRLEPLTYTSVDSGRRATDPSASEVRRDQTGRQTANGVEPSEAGRRSSIVQMKMSGGEKHGSATEVLPTFEVAR